MKIAKLIAWLGLLGMTAVLLNGFINGNFGADGAALLANPWGVVSIVDLYVGFALFSIWIAFRESSLITIIIWVILMIVLGFFAGSLYVLINLYRSQGDWPQFFLGWRKDSLLSAKR